MSGNMAHAGGRPSIRKDSPVIYVLMDELSRIRYVGQTRLPKRRSYQHRSLSNNLKNTPVSIWIRSMLLSGNEPVFQIIETHSDANGLDERERYWIRELRGKGHNLLNANDGGNSMIQTHREKLNKPWGMTLSPIQRRLSQLKRIEAYFRTSGNTDVSERIKWMLEVLYSKLQTKETHERVNSVLYQRYGY
jgi:hypothetical protein